MSYIEYSVKVFDNGDKYWRNKKGYYHREDGPAKDYANGIKCWYINGKSHREDGPAVEFADGDKHWFLEGKEYNEKEYNKKMNPLSCEGKEVEIDGVKYILKEKK